MSIVVLEDSPVAALMIRLQLELHGYEVIVADRLGALVDALRPPMPQAFLIDRNLPDGDGLSAVRELRRAGYDGPIIVVSGALNERSAAEAGEAGADAVLSKPTTASMLIDTLRSAERKRGRGR